MLTERRQNFQKWARVRIWVRIGRDRNFVIDLMTIIIKYILYLNNFNLEENKEPNRFAKSFALTALNLLYHKSQIETASFPLPRSSLLTSSPLLLILMTFVSA
jgi:hypothetical protein